MGIKDVTIKDALSIDDRRYVPPNDQLSRDDIFQVLSNDRRRYTLHYLKQREDERVPLRDIVDTVAAWENGTTVQELDSNTRKCVYTALRQSHLPRLDDAGVVDYDHLRGEARLTDAASSVQMYLEYVPENDIPWYQYYIGLSAVGASLVLLRWFEIFPFENLSWTLITGLLVGILAVSAVGHTLQARQNRLGDDDLIEKEP